jgi:hypothetical protein
MNLGKIISSEHFLQQWTQETNRYRMQHLERNPHLPTNSKFLCSVDIIKDEIYLFPALIMLMGHENKKRVEEYWTKDSLIKIPLFSQLTACNRCKAILQ